MFLVLWQVFETGNQEHQTFQFENPPQPQDVLRFDQELTEEFGYGVVFDLGSSGSRANIFNWKRNKMADCGVSSTGGFQQLRPILSGNKKIKPGVSDLKNSPERVGASLEELWHFIETTVPASVHADTPIFMFATAGLRVVAEEDNERLYDDDEFDDNIILDEDDDDFARGSVAQILLNLRNYVRTKTPFKLIRDDHIRVLTGEEEGIFDYLTVQQLTRLNPFAKLGGSNTELWHDQIFNPAQFDISSLLPICTIDLGGASTQIAVAVDEPEFITNTIPVFYPSSYASNYPGIYTHSFLDYGINRALEVHHLYLVTKTEIVGKNDVIIDPCMIRGTRLIEEINGINYTFGGSSDSLLCKRMLFALFDENRDDCPTCTFSKENIPTLSKKLKYIAFDNAYKISSWLDLRGYTTLDDYNHIAQNFLEYKTLEELNSEFRFMDEDDIAKISFRALYLSSLLHYGYGIPRASQIGFADSIDRSTLSWALGAMVHFSYSLCKEDLL